MVVGWRSTAVEAAVHEHVSFSQRAAEPAACHAWTVVARLLASVARVSHDLSCATQLQSDLLQEQRRGLDAED